MDEIIILGDLNITQLVKAQKALTEALDAEKSDLIRDAAIQRFEFTFELAWKTMKRVLKYKGITSNSPRDVIRDAASNNLIDSPTQWFNYLDDRNRTTHVYDEEIAESIYTDLPKFNEACENLINVLLKL